MGNRKLAPVEHLDWGIYEFLSGLWSVSFFRGGGGQNFGMLFVHTCYLICSTDFFKNAHISPNKKHISHWQHPNSGKYTAFLFVFFSVRGWFLTWHYAVCYLSCHRITKHLSRECSIFSHAILVAVFWQDIYVYNTYIVYPVLYNIPKQPFLAVFREEITTTLVPSTSEGGWGGPVFRFEGPWLRIRNVNILIYIYMYYVCGQERTIQVAVLNLSL